MVLAHSMAVALVLDWSDADPHLRVSCEEGRYGSRASRQQHPQQAAKGQGQQRASPHHLHQHASTREQLNKRRQVPCCGGWCKAAHVVCMCVYVHSHGCCSMLALLLHAFPATF